MVNLDNNNFNYPHTLRTSCGEFWQWLVWSYSNFSVFYMTCNTETFTGVEPWLALVFGYFGSSIWFAQVFQSTSLMIYPTWYNVDFTTLGHFLPYYQHFDDTMQNAMTQYIFQLLRLVPVDLSYNQLTQLQSTNLPHFVTCHFLHNLNWGTILIKI